MPKRAASKELNNQNWADEDDPEEGCVAPKIASPEVMSKRIIKTGKRRCTNNTLTHSSESAFSNFSGFGSDTSISNNTAKSSFSFLANDFMFKNSKVNNTSQKNDDSNNESSEETVNYSNAQTKYLAKLKGLNETILEWITLHVGKNPTCILTPIFDDYEKYLKEIKNERDEAKKQDEEKLVVKETENKSTVNLLSPNNISKSFTNINSSDNDSTHKSILLSDKNDSILNFSSASKSLGNQLTSTNSTNLFSSAISSTNSSTDIKSSFFFGNSPFTCSTPSNSNPTTSTETGEDKEDEPPKNVFQRVTEEDAVFSQRVKLFIMKKDNYVDNGVGTLYIKPVDKEGSKYQAIVRADTNLGNIILNVILKESLPSKRMGKNNVMLMCILEVDKELKPVPVLFRVKTESEADNLLIEINKYKK